MRRIDQILLHFKRSGCRSKSCKRYGISLPDKALLGNLVAWASNPRKPREVLRPAQINRIGLESWLQSTRRPAQGCEHSARHDAAVLQ